MSPFKGRLVLLTPGHAEPGGAQRRSRLLAEGLRDRDWDVRVVTRAGSLSRPRMRKSPGLAVLEVPGFGRRRLGAALFYAVALPLTLVWGARARAFVSLQLMSTTTVAGTASLMLRRPYLAMATTSNDLGELAYLRRTLLGPIRLRLLRRAAALIAQTEEVAADLRQVVNGSVSVLPNPVELPAEVPPLNGEPRLLYTGRLSSEKDLFTLLGAWEYVAAENPSASLTLAGAGGAFRSVENEIRGAVARSAVLARSVTVTGWVPSVEPHYRRCDVFVLPSREEGMSNALLEACAFGRVVIASDIGPNRAVLGDEYPLLFPVGDVGALAECMARALDPADPLRVAALARTRERIGSFSLKDVAERLEALIDATDRPRH